MTTDAEQAHCVLGCPDPLVGKVEAMDHARLMHPDHWDGGVELWPDGGVVVYDETGEL